MAWWRSKSPLASLSKGEWLKAPRIKGGLGDILDGEL